MTESASPSVPISIAIATVQGWPDIVRTVATIVEAARRANGEVLVADGSGRPPPPPDELGPNARWISAPGSSIFQLRQMAYAQALGEVIAITEDHCRVPPDWALAMLEAHARFPRAAAIGGAVENAATHHAIDWASFLVVQIAHVPPIRDGLANRLAGAVNVSYKRRALQSLADHEGMGAMDVLHQRQLNERGEQLRTIDRIRVSHDQSLGIVGTTLIHFHAGRTMSGFRRQQMDLTQWARAVGAFVIPWLRLARIVVRGSRSAYRGRILPSVPWMLWLLYSQAAGQFVGYILGPGASAHRVQ